MSQKQQSRYLVIEHSLVGGISVNATIFHRSLFQDSDLVFSQSQRLILGLKQLADYGNFNTFAGEVFISKNLYP